MREADVVVVGAGPAGAVAALELARARWRVALVEKRAVPREKVCGDALIPDALRCLDALGLTARVAGVAHPAGALCLHSPKGRAVDLRGRFLTLRREVLDALLTEAAVEAGAELLAEHEAVAMDARDGQVHLLVREGADPAPHAGELVLRARAAVLASGASSAALRSLRVPHRARPSAVAVRRYYRARDEVPGDRLHIVWERPVLPGYGWVFPLGDGVFNVGVGTFGDDPTSLLARLDAFVSRCPATRSLLAGAEPISPPRGAPLRTGLRGTTPSGAGWVAVGEAVGTTYPFSGEGIGKAMETARLGAAVVARALAAGDTSAAAMAEYDQALARLEHSFRPYAVAERWLRRPWVVELVLARARCSRRIRDILEGLVEERRSPSEILSLRGLAKAVLLP